MAFTGKATYSAGSTLPELNEDVSEIIGLISPYETALLDHLGDPQRAATSTIHEWLEDTLLPNTDQINDASYVDAAADTDFIVDNADRFQVGDQIQTDGSGEVMLVTAADTGTNTLTVVRGYGSTATENLADNMAIHILGNAALEGDDRPATRFTNRTRQRNYTQIFTAGVEVSGSQLAARHIAVADELDYQKSERLRELLRDLENCVINGVSAASNPQGDATTRRSIKGIIPFIGSNRVDAAAAALTEPILNDAMRTIWSQSAGTIDTIVVNGLQKRKINGFLTSARGFGPSDENFKDLVSVYESDFGVCRVILSRWVPTDTVLLLDSSRVDVLPLAGRNFQFKKLASTGDSEIGQVIGEYTLELRNENAHGLIHSLSTT